MIQEKQKSGIFLRIRHFYSLRFPSTSPNVQVQDRWLLPTGEISGGLRATPRGEVVSGWDASLRSSSHPMSGQGGHPVNLGFYRTTVIPYPPSMSLTGSNWPKGLQFIQQKKFLLVFQSICPYVLFSTEYRVKNDDKYIIGVGKPSVVIKSDLYSDYPDVVEFRIKVGAMRMTVSCYRGPSFRS